MWTAKRLSVFLYLSMLPMRAMELSYPLLQDQSVHEFLVQEKKRLLDLVLEVT